MSLIDWNSVKIQLRKCMLLMLKSRNKRVNRDNITSKIISRNYFTKLTSRLNEKAKFATTTTKNLKRQKHQTESKQPKPQAVPGKEGFGIEQKSGANKCRRAKW